MTVARPVTTHAACPLCGSEGVARAEEIPVRALARAYVRVLGPDLAPEFEGRLSDSLGLYACGRCELRFFSPVFAGTEALYARLQTRSWYYEREKPEYAVAAGYLPGHGRVLDVGCGAGHFREHVPGREYVGLELSSRARADAVERGIDVRPETLDAHARAFAGTYDAVVAFQVLEHVAEPRAMLLAAARCVRPGGILVVSVPSFDGFLGRSENHLLNLPPHHQTMWPDATLRYAATIVGARLHALVPEPVRMVHRDEARKVRLEELLRGVTGARRRMLSTSRMARLRSTIASAIVKLTPWPALRDARGHSVTAVYVIGASAA